MTKLVRLKSKGKGDVVGKIRIGALNKVFAYRYGGREGWIFPDDDAGREDLKILLDHYYWTNPLKMPRILALRAPWMGEQEREAMLLEFVEAMPRKYRSATLGKLLRFTGAEWKRLRVRTIAPIDLTAQERRQDSQIRNRMKVRAERRNAGMKPRAEYVANSLSKTKPWEALGMSRRDWYRKGKPQTLAQVCSNKDYYGNDRPVPTGLELDSVSVLPSLTTPSGAALSATPTASNYRLEPKRPDQHSRAELEEMYAEKRKPAWSTATVTEIEYTPTLRDLYADALLAA